MTDFGFTGWDALRHGGLLLDQQRAQQLSTHQPAPLKSYDEWDLRRKILAVSEGEGDKADFVSFVLRTICGFTDILGTWQRGTQVPAEWGRVLLTGETIKPRQLWRGHKGGVLPVFIDDEQKIGIGRGKKVPSQALQWLRLGNERLAIVTNSRQWRLIFAGLDFDAWCEWDIDLWLEEGTFSSQVTALRTLLSPELWTPPEKGSHTLLLQAILDSRKGQSELSAILGERVREAVELLVQGHGESLKERCAGIDPADIYRAAARVIMRIVILLFAESRELLPRDNPVYNASYGLGGLLGELEKVAARGGNRLSQSYGAWPRILALFRLVFEGSHYPDLSVPAYGGELFTPGELASSDAVSKALAVFESACFEGSRAILCDREVHKILDKITRTRIVARQERASTRVAAPVDFSDLSSEYIGILYEGLLDFELRTAPAGDPVIFLALGNQPALPLSRLEKMDDKAVAQLLERMKERTEDDEDDDDAAAADSGDGDTNALFGEDEEDADDGEVDEESDDNEVIEEDTDQRHATRTRAETWARRAVDIGKLVAKPKGTVTGEKRLNYEAALSKKARQIVAKVVLPGEWYLVRWGGTRKGAGTFYTRPGLAVPTVHRTLRPLAYDPPATGAETGSWTPKRPEEILALKVCDPACGSGTFPVAALRYLTDALFTSLIYHKRVTENGDRAIVRLLAGRPEPTNGNGEKLGQELLPCRPGDPMFELRLKPILRRHVVERCIYGVDLDPLAVELCRLALWVETMDRDLPFSFLDHKIKCGNALVGAWFDQSQHYPVMAWKNREGGDKNHTNGVHFQKETRGKAIKKFVSDTLTPDLRRLLGDPTLFEPAANQEIAISVHEEALATLSRLHGMSVHESADRARIYKEELIGTAAYRSLRDAMDLWCACWFWPVDEIEHAPLPTTLSQPSEPTRDVSRGVAAERRFFHWELEFPDVFRGSGSGFDAIVGNPPWETLQPNSKEYFSNIDPLYRTYGKQEALRHQKEFFHDVNVEQRWLDYTSHFAEDSNWMKFTAVPFGDPKGTFKGLQSFAIARGSENELLHRRWRESRGKARRFADADHPFRHRGEGKAYTYKLFVEVGHALLRSDGRLGFILPSGIYSDYGTAALRELLLNKCQWEWLFGFENREGIFQIHRSFKFNPVIFQKGGQTQALRTAFMRRKLEDWEHGEDLTTMYSREQVDRFSPRSKAILEIQSARDLEILEKIYSNSVLLGEEGPNGWGIEYAQGDFNMTSDSKLFPPRPKWEEQGYRPDEYGRWLKGKWRLIADLWAELGMGNFDSSERRCAQPPYDTLPVSRAEVPQGIILSRDADAWISEDKIEDTALPLYEGRMIGQFDYSPKGWVSGKGRAAVWRDISWDSKHIEPQFLMSKAHYESSSPCAWRPKLSHMRIGSATNERSALGCVVIGVPTGDTAAIFWNDSRNFAISLVGIFNSFVFDFATRTRLVGLHLDYHVFAQNPIPCRRNVEDSTADLINRKLAGAGVPLSPIWQDYSLGAMGTRPWRQLWGATTSERLRLRAMSDAIVAEQYGIGIDDLNWILVACDFPSGSHYQAAPNPKGFWRIDNERDPELRHTVLALVAFHDLQKKVEECGGNKQKGVQAFLDQNNSEGWVLPETLRLADYGLGHDDRAKEHQPVASRLGPRFFDWQLAQSAEESWKECHLHARNLLGEEGYKQLLDELKTGRQANQAPSEKTAKALQDENSKYQGKLFD